MLVTSRVKSLPELVPAFGGTTRQKGQSQQARQKKLARKTTVWVWLAGFHQQGWLELFLTVIRARSVFAQMMLFQDVGRDCAYGGIQGGRA